MTNLKQWAQHLITRSIGVVVEHDTAAALILVRWEGGDVCWVKAHNVELV